MEAYIYHITNLVNGKKYIGKSINFKHRQETHLSDLRLGKHHSHKLQRAYNKYGEENFKFEARIVQCKDEQELNLLEIEEIQRYDSYNSGYNETLGGEGHVTIFPFDKAVLIHQITQHYSGVKRRIAKHYNCDGSVITAIERNPLYGKLPYSEIEYEKLVEELQLPESNLKANYVQHNARKLTQESCLEILSVIMNKKGYDKVLCSVFGITNPTTTRLKRGLVYHDYIEKYNSLSEEEQLALCEQTIEKYGLEDERCQRARKQVKNSLTQELVNYILDNQNLKTRVSIAKELGISADRVSSVILGKSYKDLVNNYYKTHN